MNLYKVLGCVRVVLGNLQWTKTHNMGIHMKREESTKTFMMISY